MRIIFRGILLALLLCLPAWGQRTILLPPLEVAAYHDFTKSVWGTATGLTGGAPIMSGIQYLITLTNVSTRQQSGMLEMESGSVAYGAQCCPSHNLSLTFALCSAQDGSYATAGSIPRSIRWTLAPGASASLVAARFSTEISFPGYSIEFPFVSGEF